ncbi:glycosyltransferase [Desulfovibrio aerotolerans]|uniref:Glycosyltransferase n=1 Tax=Solidesulfovibrio aerotolerans TaxID=295255 RepID=A0A7C9IT07_9BACT|nr:glycosyltransferase [Solidesulfovibrio aerotolerans]MYL81900.1 glycosyltransferase [Solidesulfovibrio aerotolerans]
MASLKRPARPRVVDESGQWRTVDSGCHAFTDLGSGEECIFLGLGPDPAAAVALAGGRAAAYVECPAFVAALGEAFATAIPADWQRLDPAELTPARLARAQVYLYRQNTRLYPSFWGPLWASAQLARLPRPEQMSTSATALLFRSPAGLLEPELARALTALNRPVTDIPAGDSLPALAAVLGREKPALALSVNGAGLDDDGLAAELLLAAGVKLAVWFVDNPFHVLGRFRSRFWQRALVCVTDEAFIAPLTELGAGRVMHLPLAASAHFFQARPVAGLAERAVFVGSSAFPGRDDFFAGCRVPEALAGLAQAMTLRGERPDFFWWTRQLGIRPYWPGKAVRQAGCGAETAGLARRVATLTALAGAVPLTVYGDAGWREQLPTQVALAGPVDYASALPGVYAGAGLSVNVTSLLLPRGLTQRHFDVWAAGGCLISDATPGLALFAPQLVEPIRFQTPADAARLATTLLAQPARRAELTAAWRAHIFAEHRYEHRVAALLARLAEN